MQYYYLLESEPEMSNIEFSTSMYPVAPPFDIVYKHEATDHPVGPHSHNAAELYYTLTDLPDVLLNDKVLEVKAGTLLVIPTFCTHQLYHEAGKVYERYIFSINTQWLDSVFCEGAADFSYLADSPNPILIYINQNMRKEIKESFDKLISIKENTSIKAMSAFMDTLALIHGMTRKMNLKKKQELPISPSQRKVNDIISFLKNHLNENISIPDVSAHFYLNPDYLARLFKSHMHISIGKYIALQKISAAEEMLRNGSTVSEVQEALGYSSYAYFFKNFQKITGMSPSRYRSQFRLQP